MSSAPRALALALSLLRNRADAEDVVHDCYSRLLARQQDYDLPRDGDRLLLKSVTNACINWTQRRPAGPSLDATGREPAARPDGEPEARAMQQELEAAVAAALDELPVTQRAVIELQSLGHAQRDIAEALDISHANVRVLLHRARQALAARLGPYLENPSP